MYVYRCIYIYIYTHTCIYIKEKEREKKKETKDRRPSGSQNTVFLVNWRSRQTGHQGQMWKDNTFKLSPLRT